MTISISNFQHFSSSFQIFLPINDNFTNLYKTIYFPLLIVKIFWSCHCCTFTGNVHTMYTHIFFCEHLPTQYFFASYNSNAIKTLPTFIKPAFNVHASLTLSCPQVHTRIPKNTPQSQRFTNNFPRKHTPHTHKIKYKHNNYYEQKI